MDLIGSGVFRAFAASLATAAFVAALARFVRRFRAGGRWTSFHALVLGSEEVGGSESAGDLRFAVVLAAIATGLSWVVAWNETLRGLSPFWRVAIVGAGFPLVAIAVSLAADTVSTWFSLPEEDDAKVTVPAPAPNACLESGPHAPPAGRDQVRAEVRATLESVTRARKAAQPGEGDALQTIEETLADYARLVEEPDADLGSIAQRVRELTALARACQDDGSDGAFQLLGLRRDATPDDARRVYRELTRIYHADAAPSGVDPDKFKEIAHAYEQVRAALAAKEATVPARC